MGIVLIILAAVQQDRALQRTARADSVMAVEHVHGEDGWYAARPPLAGCRCGSCEDEDPEVRYLICESLIHDPQHEYVIDCEHEIAPQDMDNFDELWQNARF